IQTMVCVAGTTAGLCRRLPLATIEVVQSACGDRREPDWDFFPFHAPENRSSRTPPRKPKNLVLTEQFVGPVGPFISKARTSTSAHPHVMDGWNTGALKSTAPSRPAIPFPLHCRNQSQADETVATERSWSIR